MRSIALRVRAAVAGLAVVVALSSTQILAAPTLSRLGGIDEVRNWFNAAKGHPRLILLLSPT